MKMRIGLMLRTVAWLACVALWLTHSEAGQKKVAVGAKAAKFTLKDIHYLARTLDDFGQPKAFVIVFTTSGCPLAQRYLPRLQELSASYTNHPVQFLAVNSSPDDSIQEIAYQAIE